MKKLQLLSVPLFLISSVSISQAGTTIYGLKSRSPGVAPSAAPTNLFRFDGTTGGLVDLGGVTYNGNPVDADGLAWTPSGLMGFLLEPGGSRLVTIDPATAVATNISFYQGAVMRGATLQGGSIYALDVLAGSHWNLAKIDLNTLALTSTPLDTTISDVCDLDFAANGELWVAEMNAFHRLDPLTGALTFVVADNVPESGPTSVANAGFVFDETASLRAITYEVTANDDIYHYSLPNPSRTNIVPDLIPSFNAGRGDLAAVPEPLTAWLAVAAMSLLRRQPRGRSRWPRLFLWQRT